MSNGQSNTTGSNTGESGPEESASSGDAPGETGEQMSPPRYRFDEFVLDMRDRQLWRDDTRVDLNARYLDALGLLVQNHGQLVEKDQFFDEVWEDVVVSDSALTQCIKEIRKQLGDDASNPRYVQTVPGHGYRFIGPVKPIVTQGNPAGSHRRENSWGAPQDGKAAAPSGRGAPPMWRQALQEWGAGTLGGGVAGVIGGLLYGYGLASPDAGVGTFSTLLVLVTLNILVGGTGGFGIGFGLAGGGLISRFVPKMRVPIRIAGAALGGLLVGALAKLLGVDAFNLLFGRAPAGITGGPEGAVLGAALPLGVHLGNQFGERFGKAAAWHAVAGAGAAGAVAGTLISLAGGRLMGGSLDLLARSFAGSRLQLDTLAPLFGEAYFGPATQAALGSIEGLLFGSCVSGALLLTRSFGNRALPPWEL